MIKKNRCIITIVLVVIIIAIVLSRFYNTTGLIKKTINVLCSESYSPRLIWSEKNYDVTKYLASVFEKIDLEYVFDESYFHKIDDRGAYNIVGKVQGQNSNEAIVITAHFDGYEGALDNASGVAVIIDLATELIRNNKKPLKDVVFCLTNGEERVMMGSKVLVKDISNIYDKMYNINIDCVGSKKAGPMALKNISKIPESQLLYTQIKEIFGEKDVEFLDEVGSEKIQRLIEENSGVSDYVYFEKNGYANIHLSQIGISDKLTDNDSDGIDTLDLTVLKQISNSLLKFVLNFKIE